MRPEDLPDRIQRSACPHQGRAWYARRDGTWYRLRRLRLAELAAALLDGSVLDGAEAVPGPGGPPLRPGTPGQVLCLGRNFAAHARELGNPVPEELLCFARLPSSLAGPGEPFRLPAFLRGERLDPEAEVVLLVGAPLREASPAVAASAVAAVTLGNDLTLRSVQARDKERGRPWLRSKNLPGSGPFGPWWIPRPLLEPWDELELHGLVDGEARQHGRLGDLLWPAREALAEISRWIPLRPGDLLFLGTPAGVAPLRPGSVARVELRRPGEGEPLLALETPFEDDRSGL